MREYSLSSSQLKSFRRKSVLTYYLLGFLLYGFAIAILVLYILGAIYYSKNSASLAFLSFAYGNYWLTILFFIILATALLVPFTFLYRHVYNKKNRKFHQKYLELIFNECHYNEVNYAFRKKTLDKNLFKEMEEYINVKEMESKYVLSDANPKRYFEYHQVLYKKEQKNKKSGVLLIYRNTNYLEGFLQIRTKGEPLKRNYLEKDILRFGFTRHTGLQAFEVYSTLGSLTYNYEKKEVASKIEELKNFLHSDFVITRVGSVITIFFEGFEFNLTNGLKNSYHQSDFDAKVDALLRLHELVDGVIDELLTSH